MKSILLAAAAIIATPVIAQDTTAPAAPAPTMQTAPAAPAADPAMPAPATDPAMTAPATDPAMSAPAAPMASSTPTDPNAPPPAGGYQPAGPAVSGPMQPGATVRFQPAPSPDQAYPAPAPKDKYPVCKKGQYDGCMQRGGK